MQRGSAVLVDAQLAIAYPAHARQAMDGITGRPHCMTLRIEMVDGADGHHLRLSVADEGKGIAAENQARIFTHGFTTRRGGHGFGLHSCALAAREMGGTLSVHSDGPDRGAIFTLELQIRAAQVHGAPSPAAHRHDSCPPLPGYACQTAFLSGF